MLLLCAFSLVWFVGLLYWLGSLIVNVAYTNVALCIVRPAHSGLTTTNLWCRYVTTSTSSKLYKISYETITCTRTLGNNLEQYSQPTFLYKSISHKKINRIFEHQMRNETKHFIASWHFKFASRGNQTVQVWFRLDFIQQEIRDPL